MILEEYLNTYVLSCEHPSFASLLDECSSFLDKIPRLSDVLVPLSALKSHTISNNCSSLAIAKLHKKESSNTDVDNSSLFLTSAIQLYAGQLDGFSCCVEVLNVPLGVELPVFILIKEFVYVIDEETNVKYMELSDVSYLLSTPHTATHAKDALTSTAISLDLSRVMPAPSSNYICGKILAKSTLNVTSSSNLYFLIILIDVHGWGLTVDQPMAHLLLTKSAPFSFYRKLMLNGMYKFQGVRWMIVYRGKPHERRVLVLERSHFPDGMPCILEVQSTNDHLSSAYHSKCALVNIQHEPSVKNMGSCHQTDHTNLLNYEGVITGCWYDGPQSPWRLSWAWISPSLLEQPGIFELDQRLLLVTCYTPNIFLGRGWRNGACLLLHHVHPWKNPINNQLLGFVCCSYSSIEIRKFSSNCTNWKVLLPIRNKLQSDVACLFFKYSWPDVCAIEAVRQVLNHYNSCCDCLSSLDITIFLNFAKFEKLTRDMYNEFINHSSVCSVVRSSNRSFSFVSSMTQLFTSKLVRSFINRVHLEDISSCIFRACDLLPSLDFSGNVYLIMGVLYVNREGMVIFTNHDNLVLCFLEIGGFREVSFPCICFLSDFTVTMEYFKSDTESAPKFSGKICAKSNDILYLPPRAPANDNFGQLLFIVLCIHPPKRQAFDSCYSVAVECQRITDDKRGQLTPLLLRLQNGGVGAFWSLRVGSVYSLLCNERQITGNSQSQTLTVNTTVDFCDHGSIVSEHLVQHPFFKSMYDGTRLEIRNIFSKQEPLSVSQIRSSHRGSSVVGILSFRGVILSKHLVLSNRYEDNFTSVYGRKTIHLVVRDESLPDTIDVYLDAVVCQRWSPLFVKTVFLPNTCLTFHNVTLKTSQKSTSYFLVNHASCLFNFQIISVSATYFNNSKKECLREPMLTQNSTFNTGMSTVTPLKRSLNVCRYDLDHCHKEGQVSCISEFYRISLQEECREDSLVKRKHANKCHIHGAISSFQNLFMVLECNICGTRVKNRGCSCNVPKIHINADAPLSDLPLDKWINVLGNVHLVSEGRCLIDDGTAEAVLYLKNVSLLKYLRLSFLEYVALCDLLLEYGELVFKEREIEKNPGNQLLGSDHPGWSLVQARIGIVDFRSHENASLVSLFDRPLCLICKYPKLPSLSTMKVDHFINYRYININGISHRTGVVQKVILKASALMECHIVTEICQKLRQVQ